MDGAAPTTLVFADRRQGGGYPVVDQAGRTVASIRSGLGGGRFVAEDPTGATLCAASAGWWGMSNLWRATDHDGQPLLELRKSSIRSRGVVRLHRGGELVVDGSWWRRDFAVREGDEVVLSAVPQTGVLSLRPYEYAVQQRGNRLSLPEVLAVVQIWRLMRKRDDSAAAAGATTAVIAGG